MQLYECREDLPPYRRSNETSKHKSSQEGNRKNKKQNALRLIIVVFFATAASIILGTLLVGLKSTPHPRQDGSDYFIQMAKFKEKSTLQKKRKHPVVMKEKHTKGNTENIETEVTKTLGIFVLGMHESGTSTLSGLLQSHGVYFGGKSKKAGSDNFEDIHVVRQNLRLLNDQNIHPADPPDEREDYDPTLGFERIKKKRVNFYPSEMFLREFNLSSAETNETVNTTVSSGNNYPWIVKDPRLCVTLKTWIHILKRKPAIIFIFRHPVEVASLMTRKRSPDIDGRAFVSWIRYNKAAVKNSLEAGLCLVKTDFLSYVRDPVEKSNELIKALNAKCGVPVPTRMVTDKDFSQISSHTEFHFAESKEIDRSDESDCKKLDDYGLERYRDNPRIKILFNTDSNERFNYMAAMKVYCDLLNGAAFTNDYVWPVIGSNSMLVRNGVKS